MQCQVLFIHGAGSDGVDADRKLATSLQTALGAEYLVIFPTMPTPDAPAHATWKVKLSQELATLARNVILVGHSLGASTLLKYLAEERVEKTIAGLFLIAAPFWNAKDPDVNEYALKEDFASRLPANLPIFLYQSRDDEFVPYARLALYAEKLPHAVKREFDGRGHQFNDDLTEVAADIKGLNTAPC
jgi:uncharacterized protein